MSRDRPRLRPVPLTPRPRRGLAVLALALALGNAGAIAAVARYDPGDQWAAILMLAANAVGWAAVAGAWRR